MAFVNFQDIVEQVKASPRSRVVAVAAAEDKHVIEAVLEARENGIAQSILVGDPEKIRGILKELGQAPDSFEIVSAGPGRESGQAAVELVQEGRANFLMKGLMDTKDILGPVVSKDNQLRTGRVMSHVSFNQLPGYHKLIVNTDGGMLVYPSLEEKKSIIENAAITLRAMGYAQPKIAVLAGVEKMNPKMQETVDADQLMKMNQNGEITGCVVEGPVSYDVAMSKEIAQHKGAPYLHSGDYDVLVVPNLAAGNILGKSWTITAGASMAGIIVGAKAPIVLTSRGSTAEEKYLSIALAALVAAGSGEAS